MRKITFRLIFFISLSLSLYGKPPELTSADAWHKIQEILRSHATYHTLDQELVSRSFQNFIEELDPTKTYFLKDEILQWIQPSPELLTQTLEAIKREKFTVFEEIYHVMLRAMERRNLLEKSLKEEAPLSDIKSLNMKELDFVSTEEDLLGRLRKIKGAQFFAAERLDPEVKKTFFQRIEKRRFHREEEIKGASKSEQKKIVLSYVMKAISCALDSQTNYFTPSEAAQFMMDVQQRLFGIGAQLRDDLNGLTVVRILEGSPASIANTLKVGDRVIAVNQEPVVGMEITKAVELIRGPQGTEVSLTVLRPMGDAEETEKVMITLTRGEVVLKESRLESQIEPFGDGVIGILRLFSFYQDTKYSSATDLLEAIAKLKKEHSLKGIILDLRNNAGGLLSQAVEVTGLFIKKGIVVSVKDHTGSLQHLRNVGAKVAWDGPLIVLSNKVSASAAEIVAQTLQDYGRAIVVGDETTFGKGTFQIFTLETSNYGKVNPKGEYKVTRGRYYTVSGKSPQLVGVFADIVVPGFFSQMEFGEKYSKYPLASDTIAPNFEDPLTDISPMYRDQVAKLYKINLQTQENLYASFLPTLKENAVKRMQQDQNYKNFMLEISKKEGGGGVIENFGQKDLQLGEAVNLMKDLIYLKHAS